MSLTKVFNNTNTLSLLAISLKAFADYSIFHFIYGDIGDDGSRPVLGIQFLTKDEIPVVAWEDNPYGDPTKLILLHPETGEPYTEDDQPFYYLGLNEINSYYPLISLTQIDNDNYLLTDEEQQPCLSPIQCVDNAFYQANKFHYIPLTSVIGESRAGTILLDTNPNAQYKNDTELIDYYELKAENITLIKGTYSEGVSNVKYSPLTTIESLENLYYKDANGDLHPAVPGLTAVKEGATLYTATPLENKFYEPDRYYDADGNLYKDETKPGDTNTKFYKKNGIYVISDTSHIYTPGAEWNTEASKIPAGVTLGTREEYYGMEVISNLARDENTIHGLILKIN